MNHWKKISGKYTNKDLLKTDGLSENEVEYINGWSLSPFALSIFYALVRKIPEYAWPFFIISLLNIVNNDLLRPILGPPAKPPIEIFLLWILFRLALIISSIFIFIFLLRHGRRISWNRGKWRSVAEFRKSENRWFYFGTIPASLLAVAVFLVPRHIVLSVSEFILGQHFSALVTSAMIIGLTVYGYTKTPKNKESTVSKEIMIAIIIAFITILVMAYLLFFSDKDFLNLFPA
jgi:hypothetical protein